MTNAVEIVEVGPRDGPGSSGTWGTIPAWSTRPKAGSSTSRTMPRARNCGRPAARPAHRRDPARRSRPRRGGDPVPARRGSGGMTNAVEALTNEPISIRRSPAATSRRRKSILVGVGMNGPSRGSTRRSWCRASGAGARRPRPARRASASCSRSPSAGGQQLGRVAHLRQGRGADERADLDPPQPGGDEPIRSLRDEGVVA
jgi:hypothetical protein